MKVECVDKGRAAGWLKVDDLDKAQQAKARRLMESAGIGPGEGEAIVLARAKGMPVILDDAEARAVAKSLAVEHRGTAMVPYEAFARRMITREEMIRLLTDLSRVLWISPAVIAEILRRAEEVSR